MRMQSKEWGIMAVKKNYQQVKKKPLFLVKNQRGIAVVEMLPLLVVFVILFGLTFGFWTSIHSGTLSSIAARHYAFEVINNRTHFVYHRDTIPPEDDDYYKKNGYRFFAVVDEQPTSNLKLKPLDHRINLFDGGKTGITEFLNNTTKANPIWIKTGYGICLNFECGGK